MREIDYLRGRLPPLSLPALAMGALATGAIAIGAMAIARLAIGQIAVKKARFGTVEVDELTVRRLRVIEDNGRPMVEPSAGT